MYYNKKAWKHVCRLVATFTAVVAIMVASVGPAGAAGAKTIAAASSGVALLQPTPAQMQEALNRLGQAKSSDPNGFAERLQIIEESKPLSAFLSSDSRFDSRLQQEFLAASMPTDVLMALVELTDSGYLSLEVSDGPNSSKIAKIVKAKPIMVGGGMGSMGMQTAFPQCPAAWAALWAWWGTNAAFCGALGFFGPMAALGCSAAMAIAGSVIDFNRGC
jgi:hypothetical protein